MTKQIYLKISRVTHLKLNYAFKSDVFGQRFCVIKNAQDNAL